MRTITLDVEGLTDEDVQLVAKILDTLRIARRDPVAARAAFGRVWEDWKRQAPEVDETEVERLVSEAVSQARRGR